MPIWFEHNCYFLGKKTAWRKISPSSFFIAAYLFSYLSKFLFAPIPSKQKPIYCKTESFLKFYHCKACDGFSVQQPYFFWQFFPFFLNKMLKYKSSKSFFYHFLPLIFQNKTKPTFTFPLIINSYFLIFFTLMFYILPVTVFFTFLCSSGNVLLVHVINKCSLVLTINFIN